MSTLTSIFGMLPLLLMPGAGTELYRGLAAVIVGGMCVSTIFTLILLPSLLRIGEGKEVAG
jgi:multidrug efflux pump subunit AcrB